MKKTFLILALLPLLASSCSNSNSYEFTKLEEDDNYRTFYEIFPGTYYDSDGDGYGDLNGIIQKLDYIESLGFNGIWLTPIHNSPSYHGYDVNDYYSINPKLGTMNDYKNLVNECHKRDIKIILDLVINHTSTENEWFVKGIEAFKTGKKERYYDYYNFSLEETTVNTSYKNGVYYESGFGGGSMPDLNLDSENVKKEIESIIKYYLVDIGIDGFRLDAVPWYFKGNENKNIEFLSWLANVSKSYNQNAYLVAEAWESYPIISNYYVSGIDSFFAYDTDPLGVKLVSSIVTNNGNTYTSRMLNLIEQAGNYIPAPFITNHDNPRAANILQGRKTPEKLKFGQGIMQMMTGATFTYYGDEIGMIGANPPDENVRTAMFWGEEEGTCDNPAGATEDEHIYPSVKDQLNDNNSILNYYKKANYIRNKYEAIRKGKAEKIDAGDSSLQVIKKTNSGEIVYLIINFDLVDKEYDLSSLGLSDYEYESLLVDVNEQKIELNGDKIKLPSYGIVAIKNK